MDIKKLVVYTCAWGQYAKMYEQYGKIAIKNDLDRLIKDGWEIELIEVGFNLETVPTHFMLDYLRQIVSKGAFEHAYVFYCVPDQIWGENSLYNMVKLAEGKFCMNIATAYQRVDKQKFLENEQPRIFTNKELIDITFKYPHESFTDCFDDNDINCSYAGVAGRKIDDNNYVLMHSMPSVWIAQFNEYDVSFWNTVRCTGNWDRLWLTQLYNWDRLRIVGSSEIAYVIELTDREKNVPPLKKGMLNNDNVSDRGIAQTDTHLIGLKKLMYSIRR